MKIDCKVKLLLDLIIKRLNEMKQIFKLHDFTKLEAIILITII